MKSSLLLRLVALNIALLLSALAAACQQSLPRTVEDPVLRPVRFQLVNTTGGARTRTFSGIARAGEKTSLSFRVRGTILRLTPEQGDYIQKGDLIGELDPRDYELQVQDAHAALAQARAEARNAEANYRRVEGLYENKNAAKADLDATRAGAETARARVASAEKRLELAELQLSYTRLTSPISGSTAEVRAEVNENIGAGSPVLVVNAQTNPEVMVSIPESLIYQIIRGARVGVQFDALPSERFEARVSQVGAAAGESATTFPVVVQLGVDDPRILPGMAAEVEFEFPNTGRSQLVVPPHSVGEDRQGNFLFTVEEAEQGRGIVRFQRVKVGELVRAGIVILDGLQPGDLVVTAGISELRDGQQVILLGAKQR